MTGTVPVMSITSFPFTPAAHHTLRGEAPAEGVGDRPMDLGTGTSRSQCVLIAGPGDQRVWPWIMWNVASTSRKNSDAAWTTPSSSAGRLS